MLKNKKENQVYVWPLCTRFVHWLIALSFTTAFILSFFEHRLNYHVGVGIIFGLMLSYRIIWGFIGPKYATFNTFKLNLSQLKYYFVEKIQNRYRKIPAGHNPASSWYTLIVLFVGAIIVITGMLLYGIQEGRGYLSILNENYHKFSSVLLDIHIYASYTLLVWVIIHISGVLVEQFYHKTHMVNAMITGYKQTDGEDAQLCTPKNIVSFVIIALSLWVFYVIAFDTQSPFVKSKFPEINFKEESPVFYNKCSKCHKIYPPYLLPQKSWLRIMDGLDNHFGEKITDQNISKENQIEISRYLIQNSSEHSTREAALRITESTLEERPIAITKTQYWRDTHKDIPLSAYEDKKIKDKSNCFACHKDIEKGNLEDRDILYRH
jgi:cytochrome b